MMDIDIEAPKSNFLYSDRINSCFLPLFKEESQRNKVNNPNINLFSYNISNMTGNVNMNNNYMFNKENNNAFIPDLNENEAIKNSGGNQSRFVNYFKMNKNDLNQNINFIDNVASNNNVFVNSNLNQYQNENLNIYDSNNINNLNYMNKNKNSYKNYQNINKINNIGLADMKYINSNDTNGNNYNNNINSNNNNLNVMIPNSILARNSDYQEFLNYVNNLNIPLIKFLCTKKGISEMENYLESHKRNNIEILIYLLNKEGITKLMKHKFGNYFIQEIIKDAKYPLIKIILELISQNFVEIAESNSGTHVLQTLLDKVNNFELRNIIIKSIENKELEMAFNSNATYVLQKIIGIIPDNERLNMNEIIINNLINLALDSDCVFIVEKFIGTITIKQNKIRIQNILFLHCLQLSNNPYGNYLIQYILKVWKNQDIQNILNLIIENANYMVQQRYASNVIEKCFEIFDAKNRKRLIRSICLVGNILDVIKNQYGHYVLNKTIKYISEDIKIEIENLLNNKMAEMNKKEKSKSKKFISILKNNNPFKKKEKNRK